MGFQGAKKVAGEEEQGRLMATSTWIVQTAKGLVNDTPYVVKKVVKSTGKAAFTFGTWALILVLPLVIEIDREASEYELQQGAILGY